MATKDFRRFGVATAATTPLPNGINLEIRQGGIITQYFTEPVVVCGDFFSYSDNFLNISNAITNTSDYLNVTFDLLEPVVLPDGSTDNVCFVIRDDLTPIDRFQVIASGYYEVL